MWPKSADIIITQQIITSGINTPKLQVTTSTQQPEELHSVLV